MSKNIQTAKKVSNKKGNKSANSTPVNVTEMMKQLPEQCFIMVGDNEHFYYGLPFVGVQFRNILDFLGLSYRKTRRFGETVYEYWDPNCEEYEEKSLPLYFNSYGNYKTAVKLKDKAPTDWMWNAAQKAAENVRQAMRYYKTYGFAKNVLNGHTCGVILTEKIIHDQDIQWRDDKIRVFSYAVDGKRSLIMFFDLNKIENMKNSIPDPVVKDEDGNTKVIRGQLSLILDLPKALEEYVGHIIGKDHARIEFMERSLKVKKIWIAKQSESPWRFAW